MTRLLTMLLMAAGITFSTCAYCQEEWKKKFPGADAVYTNVTCDVNIQKQNGKWVAVADHYEELVYLSDNSVQLMSRGRIYHSGFTELKKWDAYTRTGGSKKIKAANPTTASSRQDYIFYDDVKATSFDFAGASVNASRHLEYQLMHHDIRLLTPHYFQRYFPVANGELRITFPSDIKIKYLVKGNHADKVTFTETKKKDKTTYSFRINDLGSEISFPDAPDDSWYSTHLIYYVEQTRENNEWKTFLATPDDLYRHSYEFIRNINKETGSELKRLTDSITTGITGPMEKARRIYRWVQTHIKYVAFEDGMEGFIPRDANLVCSRRFGDCKDMTSILTAMLNHAGVPAYFTWIGTRALPYDYSEVPLPLSDNHMICAIRDGDNFIFLDGTDDGCIFGMPASHIQGKQAMVSISEKEYRIVRVPVVPSDKNKMIDSTFLELTDKGITGRVNITLTGYFASDLHSMLVTRNEKDHSDFFMRRFARASNKIRFTNWKWTISDDYNNATLTADLELPDYAKKYGDEWFVNLNLVKLYENDRVEVEKRKMPIEYEFQSRTILVTALRIPKGSKVTYLPQGETFKNDAWGFQMKYSQSGDYVYLHQEFETDKLMTLPHQFADVNKVLDHLTPHYKQTIAISKN
ncbi:MAG TPA: transglutaminase domain-containing protein [Flavisolibacter sp.]